MPQNWGWISTDGWDVTLDYHWPTSAAGDLNVRIDYTYLDNYRYTTPGAEGSELHSVAGTHDGGPLPRHRGNLSLGWWIGAHDVNATFRYVGHYENWMGLMVDGEETDEPFIVDDFLTLDLQYAYRIARLNEATLRLGCRNCSDEDPPFIHNPYGESIHDGRGLIWYANWTQPF